jgi:hypothetical protein
MLVCILRPGYVLRLQSLGAALYFELHLRAFFERTIASHLYRRKMHEYIIAIGSLDKTITFGGVKPFHYTFFSHYYLLFKMRGEYPFARGASEES